MVRCSPSKVGLAEMDVDVVTVEEEVEDVLMAIGNIAEVARTVTTAIRAIVTQMTGRSAERTIVPMDLRIAMAEIVRIKGVDEDVVAMIVDLATTTAIVSVMRRMATKRRPHRRRPVQRLKKITPSKRPPVTRQRLPFLLHLPLVKPMTRSAPVPQRLQTSRLPQRRSIPSHDTIQIPRFA